MFFSGLNPSNGKMRFVLNSLMFISGLNPSNGKTRFVNLFEQLNLSILRPMIFKLCLIQSNENFNFLLIFKN